MNSSLRKREGGGNPWNECCQWNLGSRCGELHDHFGIPAAGDPLAKLNNTWLIKDSYWDYVKAEATTANGKNVLHLRKKN